MSQECNAKVKANNWVPDRKRLVEVHCDMAQDDAKLLVTRVKTSCLFGIRKCKELLHGCIIRTSAHFHSSFQVCSLRIPARPIDITLGLSFTQVSS